MYTSVINNSGGRKYYSFLPPHGMYLDADECITYIGEITDRLIPSWPYNTDKARKPNKIKLTSLLQAQSDNSLIIIRSEPAVVNQELMRKTKQSLGNVDKELLRTNA